MPSNGPPTIAGGQRVHSDRMLHYQEVRSVGSLGAMDDEVDSRDLLAVDARQRWSCINGRWLPSRKTGARRPAWVGGGEVSFNVKSARFHTNKHDSALSGIANPHALHSRAHHLNISPPAGPRWWHTPSSQHGTSSTRSQRETSARAGAHRIGTTTRAARRPSSYPRGMPRLHARET